MPVKGSIQKGKLTLEELPLNGAKNDLRSAEEAHKRAERRYEDAKIEFLRTGEIRDRARARYEEIAGGSKT